MSSESNLIRGASPLGLPYTRSPAPRRRRAPIAWLARSTRSLGIEGLRPSDSPTRSPAPRRRRGPIAWLARGTRSLEIVKCLYRPTNDWASRFAVRPSSPGGNRQALARGVLRPRATPAVNRRAGLSGTNGADGRTKCTVSSRPRAALSPGRTSGTPGTAQRRRERIRRRGARGSIGDPVARK